MTTINKSNTTLISLVSEYLSETDVNTVNKAFKFAEKCHEEGANLILTNAPIALRMGKIDILSKKCKSEVIPADVTSLDDLENLFIKSKEIFDGKIDFILHSVGMSPNVRKN